MRLLIIAIVALLSLPLAAQSQEPVDSVPPVRILGYLSYSTVLAQMPERAAVYARMDTLRAAYEKELARVEDEFNQKYELFLEGQRDFPQNILLKRQNELQDILQRNVAFKQQGQRDLQEAEAEAMRPLRARLNEAIATIARNKGYILVVNTDSEACPFIEPTMAENITEAVLNFLSE